MTRKEIINGLKMSIDLMLFDPTTGEVKEPYQLNDIDRTSYEAFKGAMEILAQPDVPDTNVGDTISRQVAIDALIERDPNCGIDSAEVIKELPSAQPDLSSYSDKLWRAAYERGKAEAQPQRMRGRWVEVTDGTCIWKVCDQCGEKPLWNEWKTDRCESNYCPSCGAKMDGGEQESEIHSDI